MQTTVLVSFFISFDSHFLDRPLPITYLYAFDQNGNRVATHAVVLKGWYPYGNKFMLRVRDSNKGQTVFDRVQPGEHSIEFKVTKTSNAWNLAANRCIYIELV